MYIVETLPAPWPSDEAAWADVQGQFGGWFLRQDFSPGGFAAFLCEEWLKSGMPQPVQELFFTQPPEPDHVYVLSDGSKWHFSRRACDDAERAKEDLEQGQRNLPARRNCASCKRGDPGKSQYNDPEFFCLPHGLSDRKWREALKWQVCNQPKKALLAGARDCPQWEPPR